MACIAQPYPIYTTLISATSIPGNVGYRPKIPSGLADILRHGLRPDTPPGTLKSKIVQTMFRESEAQTEPYEVDVAEPVDRSLEILTLGWLSWNNGLPAGMREVVVIERARQKRAWEKALPKPVNAIAVEVRDAVLAAIEINEWTYREVEMAAMGSLRMEIAEKCLREEIEAKRTETEEKVERYASARLARVLDAFERMRSDLRRQVRKLAYEVNGVRRRWRRANVIDELGQATSEFYGPQARFGVDPRRGHEVVNPEFRWRKILSGGEIVAMDADEEAVVRPEASYFDRLSQPSRTYKQLCIHETRWTEPYLSQLYDSLRNLRLQGIHGKRFSYGTKRLKPNAQPQFVTPSFRVAAAEEDEDLFQGALYLQRTLKGRAIQTVMFEGRVKCQELIDELKSTHALQSSLEGEKEATRRNNYDAQRAADVEALKKARKKEIIECLEGKTVGETLDFLNKELLRLQDERLTHAYALVADRERHRREAEEAGRRQAEEQRRRELDEIYKQLSKVYQNSVDMLVEGTVPLARRMHFALVARQKAEEYARRIDRAAFEANMRKDALEAEELVADLVFNHALPETQKIMVRQRLKERQSAMLAVCHDEIYSGMERAARGPRNNLGHLKPMPRPPKHKVPNLISVKFLKLKRMSASLASSQDSSAEQSPSFADTGNAGVAAAAAAAAAAAPSGPAGTRNRPALDDDRWSTGFSPQDVVLRGDPHPEIHP